MKAIAGRQKISIYMYPVIFTTKTMNTIDQQYFRPQLCSKTLTQPIDWEAILARTATKWTPKSVRRYLFTICHRMNTHFAVIMDGRDFGKIAITRFNRDNEPVIIVCTIWKCTQLFNRKIGLQWNEDDKRKRIHMTAFALWLKSGNRKEIRPPISPNYPITPAAIWLQKMLLLADNGECPIVFDSLNTRQAVYESFWNVIGVERKAEWLPKTISQAVYNLLPSSRPIGGRRSRIKGVGMINIPTKQECRTALGQEYI